MLASHPYPFLIISAPWKVNTPTYPNKWANIGHLMIVVFKQYDPIVNQHPVYHSLSTLWLFNIVMENDPFIDDFLLKTSIYSGFSMAMLNNQMVFIGSTSQLLCFGVRWVSWQTWKTWSRTCERGCPSTPIRWRRSICFVHVGRIGDNHTQMIHVWNIYLQNWVIYRVNVGKYTIHGSSGIDHLK